MEDMKDMKDYLEEIDGRFPVRNAGDQKQAFREYAAEEARGCGFSVRTVRTDANDNVVIGDPAKADVVFTAHYDTPRRALLPNLMIPLNPFLRYAYLLLSVLMVFAVSIWAAGAVRDAVGLHGAAGRAVYVGAYMLIYFGLYLLLFRGGANRRNRNDNTSGVAAVMTLCRKLAGSDKAAMILFDNEEKGKKGSRAYARENPDVGSARLVVNMDCVGNGDNWIVCASDAAAADPGFPALREALEGIGAKIYPSSKANLNSDQKSFEKGVGICACKYRKGAGYYTPRIHTRRDTEASGENILRLADALASFARGL